MGKRKNKDDDDRIRRKIKKLEKKLQRKRIRVISSSDEEFDESVQNTQEEHVVEVTEVAPVPIQQDAVFEETPVIPTDAAVIQTPSTSAVSQEVNRCPEVAEDPELDEEILSLLGEAPKPEEILGNEIHKDIANRWQLILTKGLPKEPKQKLLQDYRVPKNCEMLLTPIINPEIKAGISELTNKKEASLMLTQKQISIALAALSQATNRIVCKDFTPQEVLKPLSDACKLMCDSFYYVTKARRNLVINTINTELKDTLSETIRDKFLFGADLSEKLKSAKTIQKTGESLKPSQFFNPNRNHPNKKNPSSTNRLNWKPPLRKPAARTDAGKPRPAQRTPAPPPPPPPSNARYGHASNSTRSRSPPRKFPRKY